MRVDRRWFITATALSAVTTTFGLGARAAGKALTIATSMPSLTFPFFVHMQRQLAAEAKTLGDVKLIEMG